MMFECDRGVVLSQCEGWRLKNFPWVATLRQTKGFHFEGQVNLDREKCYETK